MRKAKPQPSSLARDTVLPLEERIQRLVAKMREGIRDNQPVDLGTPPHREITEALRRLVYEAGEAAHLPVVYGDNTRGKEFPIRALWLPDTPLPWKHHLALHIGTLTFRHLDYDDYTDVYLIRDRETRVLVNADIESLAYERMMEILSDPHLAGEAYLAIFHTGLEPLIVGLYRALVEHLRQRRAADLGQMVIQPVYFIERGQWATGTLWG